MMCAFQNQSISIETMNAIGIFHFDFFNMNISVTLQDFNLNFSVCNPNILFEGRVSQNFDLGPSYFWCIFSFQKLSSLDRLPST